MNNQEGYKKDGQEGEENLFAAFAAFGSELDATALPELEPTDPNVDNQYMCSIVGDRDYFIAIKEGKILAVPLKNNPEFAEFVSNYEEQARADKNFDSRGPLWHDGGKSLQVLARHVLRLEPGMKMCALSQRNQKAVLEKLRS